MAFINGENIFIRIIPKWILDIVLIFVRTPKFIVIIQITLQTNLSKIVYDSDGKKINLDLLTYTDNSRSENEKKDLKNLKNDENVPFFANFCISVRPWSFYGAHVSYKFRFLPRIYTWFVVYLNQIKFSLIGFARIKTVIISIMRKYPFLKIFLQLLFRIEENLSILKSPQIYFKASLTLTYVFITLSFDFLHIRLRKV